MAHHRRADRVGHKLVLMAVPHKQHRAGTASAVGLFHGNHWRVRQIDFVLQHAGGPQDAQQVNALRIAQSGQNLWRTLRLIPRGPGQFPLLPVSGGENLYLHAQSRLVVRKSGQIEAHGVIFVAAYVAQQHRRRVQLGHNQAGRAVARNIGGNQPARRDQLNLVQAQRMAHILKTAVAAIAKDAHLRTGVAFDNCGQINPSVVVNVNGRQAPSAPRTMQREFHSFKPPANILRSCNVAPQREAWRAGMGHCNVHPAVLVVVEHGDACSGRQLHALIKRLRWILPFPRIHIDQRRRPISGHRQIHSAVVVEIRKNGRGCHAAAAQSGWFSPLGKGLIAVVAPQNIRRAASLNRRPGQQQIEIAVVIVVHKRNPGGPVARPEAGFGGHVLKLSLAQIAKQQYRVVEGHGQIVEAVAVIVAHGAGHGVPLCLQPRRRCVDFFKRAVCVAVQNAYGLLARLHQHQVHASGAGRVHHAGPAGGCECGCPRSRF